jgi:hypothetical protein
MQIVIGSIIKGLLAGLIIGIFARYIRSLPLGVLFGLAVGLALAYGVAHLQGKHYLEILLPGGFVGLILGYATQKFHSAPATS